MKLLYLIVPCLAVLIAVVLLIPSGPPREAIEQARHDEVVANLNGLFAACGPLASDAGEDLIGKAIEAKAFPIGRWTKDGTRWAHGDWFYRVMYDKGLGVVPMSWQRNKVGPVLAVTNRSLRAIASCDPERVSALDVQSWAEYHSAPSK